MGKRRQIKNVELELPYSAGDYGLTQEVADEITNNVANAFQQHLLDLATERLSNETALKYVNSVVRVGTSDRKLVESRSISTLISHRGRLL
jgi:hypothetical protein